MSKSTDWRNTTEQIVALQNEWKTIGPSSRKNSQLIWERFRSACDAYFKAKDKAFSSVRATERENLEKKKEILAALANLKEDIENATVKGVRELMNQWAEVGHVPFKDKEALQEKYRELTDFFYDKLDMKGQRRRLEGIKDRVARMADNGGNSLQRTLERKLQELKTYENNLGFLTAKSKSGNGMLALMQSKMNDLKAEIDELKKKISAE